MKNTLYYGDNLEVLRQYIKDETVDLIYLDPPFNSNANYNVLFAEQDGTRAAAQIQAFQDTWQWDQAAAEAFEETVIRGGKVADSLRAFQILLGNSNMLAYLAMMAPRLVELHRVLKPTGSLYLHCDPTASHYLKIVLDAIFGIQSYQNEIIWKRTSSHSDAKKYAKISDTLFFYSKTGSFTWNSLRTEYDQEYLDHYYNNKDSDGRRFTYDNLTKPKGSIGYFYNLLGCEPPPNGWRMPESRAIQWIDEKRIEIPPTGKTPRYRRYVDELKGVVMGNIWDDIPPVNSQAKDALGYPTQKPMALLERILLASSNPGDVVLDPFCGCGTAIAAAQKLDRRWIGIDITHLAIGLIKTRMKDTFGETLKFDVVGEPVSITGAQMLAQEDPFQFQAWALSLVGARLAETKKGADHGIDGRLYFMDEPKTGAKQVIISVKGGHTRVDHVRDLRGVIDREQAQIGVLITLQESTKPMRIEAASAGFYTSPWGKHPRLQILTISELLDGAAIDLPPVRGLNQTFKKAPRHKSQDALQLPLGDENE